MTRLQDTEGLEAYDRNSNFGRDGGDLITDETYDMVIPPLTDFRDVTVTNCQGLQKSSAMVFMKSVEDTLSSGRRLYKERFVRYLRSAKSQDNICYRGQCHAEMKRSVTYLTHVLLDKEGDVLETQCECAAGAGPAAHCKHIQALMLALIDVSEGKVPQLELSCTDVIQTFHKPKKIHRGSPVKARNLRKNGEDSFFDPRPVELRNVASYPDYVKNMVVNFCSVQESTMPLLQTASPADVYALEHDHHYLKYTSSENFLRNRRITTITPEEADTIEGATVNHDEKWKAERLNRIGSSMFGKVMGTVSEEGKLNLARNLIHHKQFTSKYTDHGINNEPHAIKKYEELKKVKVRPCGITVCMDKPYLASTPDGLVGDDVVLEVKCPYTARNKPINTKTVPYLMKDGDKLKLDPKHDYYAQVQGQMLATERSMCHFVVYTLLPDIQIVEVPYNKLFVDGMLEKLDDFFVKYFKPAYLKRHFYKDTCS